MMKRMLAGRSSIMFIVSDDCRRSFDGPERSILSILFILPMSLGTPVCGRSGFSGER
jgi:hypothetical protein